MTPAERVALRYRTAANKALTDAEYQKASADVLLGAKRVLADIEMLRQNVLDMSLTLKDRGHYRDASTLMGLAPALMDVSMLDHLIPLVDRLKRAPADTRKPAPAKPGARPNPWTTPLK